MFGFGFIWWLLRWSFATVLFIGIMVAAGYYVFNEAVAGGEYVTVPDIGGREIQEAKNIVLREGLDMGSWNYTQADDYPENHVIHQNPAAGNVVRAGRKVYATVNQRKKETEVTPNVIGETVERADQILRDNKLRASSMIARIANTAQEGTIVGQDPGAGTPVAPDTEVRLLVSDGMGAKAPKMFMPDLLGLSPEEARQELAPLNVNAQPFEVSGATPPFDEVFDQIPAAGTLLKPQDRVIYRYRTNPESKTTEKPPGTWREVTVEYVIPPFWMEREVQIDVVYTDGKVRTAFPPQEYYVDGLPPKYQPGTRIRQGIPFQDEVTVVVLLDGEKVRSYYYQGDADPVIRDFGSATGESSSAGT
jgi:beta-lactam-binding protein with PASTA domain